MTCKFCLEHDPNPLLTSPRSPQNAELFTACLSSSKGTNDSFYTFGYIDTSVTGGQTINYTPVDNSQGFWQIPSTSAHVNGKQIHRKNNTSIMDTGTTLCLVDDNFAKAIYAAIPGATYDSSQQGWIFPTNTATSALPVVTIAIGAHQYTINKEDIGFADAVRDCLANYLLLLPANYLIPGKQHDLWWHPEPRRHDFRHLR
jgi:hypothetical protein